MLGRRSVPFLFQQTTLKSAKGSYKSLLVASLLHGGQFIVGREGQSMIKIVIRSSFMISACLSMLSEILLYTTFHYATHRVSCFRPTYSTVVGRVARLLWSCLKKDMKALEIDRFSLYFRVNCCTCRLHKTREHKCKQDT
jgi:hypothetical protein